MSEIARQIVADSMEMRLPEMVERRQPIAEAADMASVVIGMRRVGKTWLLLQKIKDLLATSTERRRILYANFEDERLGAVDAGFLTELDAVFSRTAQPETNAPLYYFFDEIQCVNGWERFVRRALDRRNARIFLTGSSSRLLSREVATAMRGRALETRLSPFSFEEFLAWRKVEKPADIDLAGRETRAILEREFEVYMALGGFPGALSAPDSERRQILQSYINTVIFRDIVERHGITGLSVLRYLIRRLLASCAGDFSVNKFCNELKSQGMKCGKDTLHDYLGYLEDAFLFAGVTLETDSERRRMVNPRKIYAVDHGLVSACVPPGGAWGTGRILENIVYMELKRRGLDPRYGITKDGFGVDFVLRDNSGRKMAIQVCADPTDAKTLEREVRALDSYDGTEKRLVITLFKEMRWTAGLKPILLVPAWKWLLSKS
jgi:predicted AAA+ superfamily ATPase